jgi:hypothetical protein
VLAQTSFTFVALASPTPKPSPKPTPTAISKSAVTIKPSSFSCSAASVDVALAIQLSASIPSSAEVTSELDGSAGNPTTVETGFVQQPDGSWLSSYTTSSSALCEQLSIGQHRIGALDSAGKVIAEGTFTLKP